LPSALTFVDQANGSRVELPKVASAPFRLADEGSRATVTVRLLGAEPTAAIGEAGRVRYRGALAGGDLVHHAIEGGTEDFVYLPDHHGLDAIRYEVTLGEGIRGLRLVDRVVEFLDAGGAPRLRMGRPWARTVSGERVDLAVEVEGCAVDRDPRAPFGRPITPPGDSSCVVALALPTQEALEVDPAWITGKLMTEPRMDHAAALLDSGQVLIAGGDGTLGDETSLTAELFDPQTSTFAATNAMGFFRSRFPLVRMSSGAMMAIGGLLQQGIPRNVVERYDPSTGIWGTPSILFTARFGHTGTPLADGRVLAVGGITRDGNSFIPLDSVEIYSEGSWSVGPSMAVPRAYPASVLLQDGRVLVTGGAGASIHATTELFDPQTNTWEAGPTMLAARSRHSALVLPDGRVLIVGGPGTAEILDVAAGTSIPTEPFPEATRVDLGLVLLGSGEPLVVGGVNPSKLPLELAGTLALSTLAWSDWPVLGRPRGRHITTLLADGRVLAAGGLNIGGTGATRSTDLGYPTPSTDGANCLSPIGCASGWCVDGVCCGSICDGTCEACAQSSTGVASGTCAPIQAGLDPDDECDPKGVGFCAQPGHCDGNRHCATQTGLECAATSCVSDTVQGNASVCSASGDCIGQGTSTCFPYRCDAGSCISTCVSHADCADPAKCVDGACTINNKLSLGQGCGASTDCASGRCVDGVCCDAACDGACESCLFANTGAPSGQCAKVHAGTDPRGRCPADAPEACGADGLCDETGACRQITPEGASCGTNVCLGTYVAERRCNDSASCIPMTERDCGAFGCDPILVDCRTSCTIDSECAPGFVCQHATGACVAPSIHCTDAVTSETSKGEREECAPFACRPEVGCLKTCATATDCASTYVCREGRCGSPPASSPAQAPSTDSGCSVGAGASRPKGMLLMVGALFVLKRRRSRALQQPSSRLKKAS
jgi:hypothetical protein